MSDITGDPQFFREFAKEMRSKKPMCLGIATGWGFREDPRRLAFALARYKFVAKMLDGSGDVLEVGCGDGFGTRVVAQAVGSVIGIDLEPDFIASANELICDPFPMRFFVHDIIAAPMLGSFDAVYCMDVLEHIDATKEAHFLTNMVAPLKKNGVCIIGLPSLESQAYATTYSRKSHINCKEQPALKSLMQEYFNNVFMFSMNDEIVHTGFSKMSHYNIALCCGKK